MTLDNESQRESLLNLINSSTLPGSSVEQVYTLLQAIKNAKIEDPAIS